MNSRTILQQIALILLFLAIVATMVVGLWPEERIEQPPGVIAQGAPKVTRITKAPTEENGYEFLPVAQFSVTARILERKNYYYVFGMNLISFDRPAEVSPVDFLMGWNEMSDEVIVKEFRFYLDSRTWSWKPDDINDRPKLEKRVEENTALLHIIPADAQIERKLDEVLVGHFVALTGDLVKVSATQTAYSWGSSKAEDSMLKKDYIIRVTDLRIIQ